MTTRSKFNDCIFYFIKKKKKKKFKKLNLLLLLFKIIFFLNKILKISKNKILNPKN